MGLYNVLSAPPMPARENLADDAGNQTSHNGFFADRTHLKASFTNPRDFRGHIPNPEETA